MFVCISRFAPYSGEKKGIPLGSILSVVFFLRNYHTCSFSLAYFFSPDRSDSDYPVFLFFSFFLLLLFSSQFCFGITVIFFLFLSNSSFPFLFASFHPIQK